MPTAFSVEPTLVGERVPARPSTPADIDDLGPVLADPDVDRLPDDGAGPAGRRRGRVRGRSAQGVGGGS